MNGPPIIKIGDWTARPAQNLLERDGRSVKVEPRTMEVLLHLASRAGEVVSADEFINTVWQGRVVGDGAVYKCINHLRQTLGDGRDNVIYIQTIPKRGYLLVAPVTRANPDSSDAAELTPDGIEQTKSAPPAESPTRAMSRKREFVIIGLLTVAGMFLVVDNYVLDTSGPSVGAEFDPASLDSALDETVSTAATEQREILPNSVAVLPFENLSADPEDAFFAAGIHEEILDQLAKLSALNVIARTSVMQYADGEKTISEIAKELNVKTGMEGSVRYADEHVLVTVQLIDPETNSRLWSNSYKRELSDIFSIQADIAMNIANALEAEFSLAEQEALEKQPTESPEAYALYLRAISRFGPPNGLSDLDRATRLDPEFALAYALKAYRQSTVVLGLRGANSVEASELEYVTKENAERALALDSTLCLAHAALAAIHIANWRGAEAEQALQRAYQLSPNDAVVLQLYARFKRYRGEYPAAIELMQRAVELDPNYFGNYLALGVAYRFARDYGPAVASLRRGLELEPTSAIAHMNLAVTETALGNFPEALKQLNVAEVLWEQNGPNTFRLAQMAFTYSQAGRPDEAVRLFNELEERARKERVGEATWARAYMAIGDYERGLQHLEAAVRERVPTDVRTLVGLSANSAGDPILDTDPRFQKLLSGLWETG